MLIIIIGCNSACVGLEQCTSQSVADCCNYYNQDGSCTVTCPPPFQPLSDNTCGCRPGTILMVDNTCGCPPGFTGPLCDMAINFCGPDTCMNSGTCSSSSSGFSCACPLGFTGMQCETPSCSATTCANGGTCMPLVGGGFECMCQAGFGGNMCLDNVNECEATPSPCLNGGTCTDSFGSYMCSCQGQWEGQDCGRCGITNCTVCSTDGTTCIQCVGGFFVNSENTCCKQDIALCSIFEPSSYYIMTLQLSSLGPHLSAPWSLVACVPRTTLLVSNARMASLWV